MCDACEENVPMKLLFICTHNRCRSILAEAITKKIGTPYITAASAGSEPAGEVHPSTLKYLDEHEIDIEGLASQPLSDFRDFSADAIITLCDSANDTCPAWAGNSVQVHWGLKDPSKVTGNEDQIRAAFNTTIDLIERRLESLLKYDLPNLSGDELAKTLNTIATLVH